MNYRRTLISFIKQGKNKIVKVVACQQVAEDPCNPVDGFFFIWMSMAWLDAGTTEVWKK